MAPSGCQDKGEGRRKGIHVLFTGFYFQWKVVPVANDDCSHFMET